jgi:hypothetical protein
MDKKLRLFAGAVIAESGMSKQAKLQLLNFVKEEASDSQVKALLMDGKIVDLDEQAEEIVNDRFKNHPVRKNMVSEATFKSLFGMFLLSPSGWVAWRAIKAMVSKENRKCGVLAIGKPRDICMLRVKQMAAKRKIDIIKSNMDNCKNSKKPEKCLAAGKKKLAKFQDEYNMLGDRISDLQKSGAAQVASKK